ncbi:FMN-dependent NADH-azoreductase [Pararhodospirillum photometricum]|uniref:FMN dependent NADH:quinone oxidoreductase n=1 Tax=Pararhodospirillum photometricum DSM 122 TaxID=1150469 RepID=H6SQQ9_PARPM|nr:NAD(P)H-dependent oxidoreductase [Pararhodospirillum photometricum]CCG07374.1 NAD(P)H dehydrogenase (Quinone) [Pararhodospirillum photometricum DSM 122]
MTLLHLDSSLLGDASVTRHLTQRIVATLTAAHPGTTVVRRDLAAQPPAPLDAELIKVVKFRDLTDLTARQQAELALTDTLVDEFLAAETVVIGAPMYNFSIPTPLKAWIDRVAQPGRTFRYTETGPQGLAGGRRVIIASARGGRYAGTPAETAFDHQEAYLKAVMTFFGIPEVEIIRAEGVAMGDEARAAALAAAEAQIQALV